MKAENTSETPETGSAAGNALNDGRGRSLLPCESQLAGRLQLGVQWLGYLLPNQSLLLRDFVVQNPCFSICGSKQPKNKVKQAETRSNMVKQGKKYFYMTLPQTTGILTFQLFAVESDPIRVNPSESE